MAANSEEGVLAVDTEAAQVTASEEEVLAADTEAA
jgi:hypothetical protein